MLFLLWILPRMRSSGERMRSGSLSAVSAKRAPSWSEGSCGRVASAALSTSEGSSDRLEDCVKSKLSSRSSSVSSSDSSAEQIGADGGTGPAGQARSSGELRELTANGLRGILWSWPSVAAGVREGGGGGGVIADPELLRDLDVDCGADGNSGFSCCLRRNKERDLGLGMGEQPSVFVVAESRRELGRERKDCGGE